MPHGHSLYASVSLLAFPEAVFSLGRVCTSLDANNIPVPEHPW